MRIGIDLGGTKIEGLLLDRAGREIRRERLATPQHDYDATVRAVCGLVNGLAQSAGDTGLDRFGVGMPGSISPVTGTVRNANSVWLNGRDLPGDLEAASGMRVRVANDANCFALSEAVDGAGKDGRIVFGVILGTGVGGGLVIDKRPVEGRNKVGGEWGHNPLPDPEPDEIPGPPCFCGRTGCVETFLSGPGLALDFTRHDSRTMSASDIVAAAENGDHAARSALERYERRLAKALAVIINIADPNVIVLGGGLSNIARLYAHVPELWKGHVFSDSIETTLVAAEHGDSSGVRGAAWLWPAG